MKPSSRYLGHLSISNIKACMHASIWSLGPSDLDGNRQCSSLPMINLSPNVKLNVSPTFKKKLSSEGMSSLL